MKFAFALLALLSVASADTLTTVESSEAGVETNPASLTNNPVVVETANGEAVQAVVDSRQVYSNQGFPIVPIYLRQLPGQNGFQTVGTPVVQTPQPVVQATQPVVQYVPVAMVVPETGRIIPFGGGVSGNVGPLGGSAGLGFSNNNGFGAGLDFGLGNKYYGYGSQPTYQTYYNPQSAQPIYTTQPTQQFYNPAQPTQQFYNPAQPVYTTTYQSFGRTLDNHQPTPVQSAPVHHQPYKHPVVVPYFYKV